jgi:hypothetical protein
MHECGSNSETCKVFILLCLKAAFKSIILSLAIVTILGFALLCIRACFFQHSSRTGSVVFGA